MAAGGGRAVKEMMIVTRHQHMTTELAKGLTGQAKGQKTMYTLASNFIKRNKAYIIVNKIMKKIIKSSFHWN